MNVSNVSNVSDEQTARTAPDCAEQRADHLQIFGAKRVLELCVGPSLATLKQTYAARQIHVTGNDIDPRWKTYYPVGPWLIGDAFAQTYQPFDAIVFAPPLSAGCSGRREDALMVDAVLPRYTTFLEEIRRQRYIGRGVLVLPARAMATTADRQQMFRLLAQITLAEVVPLRAGVRQITKYYDVYFDTATLL